METIIKEYPLSNMNVVTSIMTNDELVKFKLSKNKTEGSDISDSIDDAFNIYFHCHNDVPKRLLLKSEDLKAYRTHIKATTNLDVDCDNPNIFLMYRGVIVIECKSNIKPTFTN